MVKTYKYETHLHTSEGSACGATSGARYARVYKELGYDGIIITDHFCGGNTGVDEWLPWNEWVDSFCQGYENAKAEGDRIGLSVFFGFENGFRGTKFFGAECLIYGVDKEWLKENPSIRNCDVRRQYEMVSAAGGLVVHAHPFRERPYIPRVNLFPEYVDAVEICNLGHRDIGFDERYESFDEKAKKYAIKYHLAETAGGDCHSEHGEHGGMAFYEKIETIEDFIRAVKGRKMWERV